MKFLQDPIKCLDHGFVRYVDHMGNDCAITDAARVSYGKGTKTNLEDNQLINYLLRHKHTTPFEMVEVKFHCKMPLFVARQWIRHRTANVNEYSGRYSILDKEFYIPQPEQLASQSKTNKQGRADVIEGEEAERALQWLKDDAENAYNHYQLMVNEDAQGQKMLGCYKGLARELARMNLPVNIYTQWYWKCDLHNIFNFLRLRMDSHAQYEIRVFANAMAEIIKQIVPVAYSAFEEYILYSMTLSRKEQRVLSRLIEINDKQITMHQEFSKGEWNEFMTKLESLMKYRVDVVV